MTLDKNYYPVPFPGGTSLVACTASGTGTIETHEFYDGDGKVVFWWKVKKDANGTVIDFRIKIPKKPQTPAQTYKTFDTLS